MVIDIIFIILIFSNDFFLNYWLSFFIYVYRF